MKTLYEQWLIDNQIERCRLLSYDTFRQGYEWHGKSILTLSQEPGWPGNLRDYRHEAIGQFSFAILDEITVQKLLPYSPFLEVGCGTGYWAYELIQAGGKVISTDPHPYKEHAVDALVQYLPIDPLTAQEAITRYGTAHLTLFMVWPQMESWPAEALRLWTDLGGQCVVYVGEGNGGCTADEKFHEILDEQWELIEELPVQQWFGIHDYCSIYQRK